MKHIWLITWTLIMPILFNPGLEMSWMNKGNQPERVKDILVLSVAGNADSTAAISMESEVANELRSYNYRTESAIAHFGNNAFSKIREEETIKQLYPYDAVIILSLVNENQRHAQVSECNDFFWEYYDSKYSAAHNSHTSKANNYFWELSFFEISSWKLKYRMKTFSVPSSQVEIMACGFGKLITKEMLDKNIIHPLPDNLKAF